MDTLFSLISVIVYLALLLLAVWGAFCVILAWRRTRQVQFRSEKRQEEFLNELHQSLQAKNVEAALDFCADDRRAVPALAHFALTNQSFGYAVLRRRLVERFQRDILADLEHQLSWVYTVVKSAPMVGLLGTVIGMMGAFANLSSGGKVDTIGMARDIQFALITTACGLAIAIPLVMCTNSINVRMRKMQDLVDSGLTQLLEILKPVLPP
ncbi:MAG: MotA/TolQ/ExbB proton channel family protein [Pirellulales bacterium]